MACQGCIQMKRSLTTQLSNDESEILAVVTDTVSPSMGLFFFELNNDTTHPQQGVVPEHLHYSQLISSCSTKSDISELSLGC